MAYDVASALACIEQELRWVKARLADLEMRLNELEDMVREAISKADEALEAVGDVEVQLSHLGDDE